MKCRNCGGEFSAERAELGYDYCTSPACVEACLEPLNVVAVAVNKAADSRSMYATEVAGRGRVRRWPPAPGKRCWCGRDKAYETCCGA